MGARCFLLRHTPLNKMQTSNSSTISTYTPTLFFLKTGPGFQSLSRQVSAKLLLRPQLWRPFNQTGFNGGREVFRLRGLYMRTRARRRRKGPAVTEVLREKKEKEKKKELQLEVQIGIEEEIPEDDQGVLNIAEILRLDALRATKVALGRLKDSDSVTRDRSVDNLSAFDMAELSILLCNDNFIQKLNKDWRDKDAVTDVISMSQHIPGLRIPILMLGDIVISMDTAARQAEERGQTLIDEMRILMVHGLLHLLGYDHELSEEAEKEMEKEEEFILSSLGWKGKGLIHSTYEAFCEDPSLTSAIDEEKEN